MPFKVWALGEEVLSADFNPLVQEQVVATFANAAARTAAIVAPKVGQVTHVPVSGVQTWDGGAWRSSPPAGAMIPFAGAAAAVPATWLLCAGQALSRATYADLFAALGVLWGAGDGSTTFNLPNFAGRSPMGVDSSQAVTPGLIVVGALGGAAAHAITLAELPPAFNGTTYANGATSNNQRLSGQLTGGAGVGSAAISIPLGSGAAMPMTHAVGSVNFIIKA